MSQVRELPLGKKVETGPRSHPDSVAETGLNLSSLTPSPVLFPAQVTAFLHMRRREVKWVSAKYCSRGVRMEESVSGDRYK